MGAGVDHAVGGVGVGQVVARLAAIKGELHDLHARVAAGGQHGFHLGGQVAQVFRDDAALPKRRVHGVDEGAVGAFFPVAARRRLVPGGDGVVALKATEVVDAHHIVDGRGVAHPALPPGKILGLVAGPVVERVAPELAVGSKGVGRAARHLRQVDFAVGLEEFRPGPEVAGVRADVDGNVAHQPHAMGVGVGFQGVPLGVEEELYGLVVAHLVGEAGFGLGQRLGLAAAQVVRPIGEACLILLRLDGHKEGVIVQPEALRFAESFILRRGGSQQADGGFVQHGGPLGVERAVIHTAHGLRGGDFLRRQQARFGEKTVINEIGVARKSGKALVRAVAVAGGADGQNLPIGLPGFGEEIHEGEGFAAQRADAKGPRQAENGHQNAACTHGAHLLNP